MSLNMQQQPWGPTAGAAPHPEGAGANVNASVHHAGGMGGLGGGPQIPNNVQGPSTAGAFAAAGGTGLAGMNQINAHTGFVDTLSVNDPPVLLPGRGGLGAFAHRPHNVAPFSDSAAASAESAVVHGGPAMMHPGPFMPPAAVDGIRQIGLPRPQQLPPSPAAGDKPQVSAPSGSRRVNAMSDGSGSIIRNNDGAHQRSSRSEAGGFGGGAPPGRHTARPWFEDRRTASQAGGLP
ncbi:hypothetical protein GPECTOR_10g917 [Gonium pectorale]|uniref:Uncharacterized protein n=1 Tax=Gonium pectorale TaxID=33097 RepID=A0A150GR28_GONPE|nr:hypothetical protein GPECTOR_10g917 [Gonium pectorale]|eukprot:KXZ52285.1 hypothetical protein GPECTOR_10g917 [Gonium pectorale]